MTGQDPMCSCSEHGTVRRARAEDDNDRLSCVESAADPVATGQQTVPAFRLLMTVYAPLSECRTPDT